MKINEREIRYEESFYEALQGLESYWGQSNARTGKKWASELVDFTLNAISPIRWHFPDFPET